MGFGLLFVGYFFLIFFPLDSVNVLPNLAFIGCVPMLLGLGRLMHYCPDCVGFKRARIALIPLSLLSLAMLILRFVPISGAAADYLKPTLSIAATLTICIFCVFLFAGIHKLSKQVGLPKLANRSVRMMALTIAYTLADAASYACSIILTTGALTQEQLGIVITYTALFAMLLEYISLFLNMALIFTCYIRICLEGDEDMPYREDLFDKIIARTKRNKK